MSLLAAPLSLYSLPASWVLALIPANLRVALIQKTAGYDNVNPRANADRKQLAPDVAGKVKRLEGAHSNGLESFALWTAALLAGTVAKLDNTTLNAFAASYLALRVAYTWIYINQTSQALAFLRTTVWFVHAGLCLVLMVMAGNKPALA